MTNLIGALLLYTLVGVLAARWLNHTLSRPINWTGPLTAKSPGLLVRQLRQYATDMETSGLTTKADALHALRSVSNAYRGKR